MLLLPLRDKSLARNVPVMSLLFALVCGFVFFALQVGDAMREQHAFEFYRSSGLGDIERPLYRAYLAVRTDPFSSERLHELQSAPPDGPANMRLVEGDARFLSDLHAKRVIREGDPQYSAWESKRAHYEELAEATFAPHYSLRRSDAGEAWRFVTYVFLHASFWQLMGNMLVLLILGPFVEAALGPVRFAITYLAGAVAAGAVQVLVSDASVVGSSGAIAATAGMLAVLYGMRKVPVYYWFGFVSGTTRFPPIALLAVWLLNEGFQWATESGGTVPIMEGEFAAHAAALCTGALIAWVWRPRARISASESESGPRTLGQRGDATSALAAQAHDAATRLDIRRATRLYKELVEAAPKRIDYLAAYLNATLLGADEESVLDAALRLLWAKFRTPTDELRRTFLMLTQPKVLKSLPIDEHLRLARRLVRFREDAAALRVIDAILRDDHLRELYGRQLADCLLGLFTAYKRNGLQRPAEQINSRLSTYFPAGAKIGGVEKTSRPPSTIFTALRPSIANLSLSEPGGRHSRPPPTTRGDKSQ